MVSREELHDFISKNTDMSDKDFLKQCFPSWMAIILEKLPTSNLLHSFKTCAKTSLRIMVFMRRLKELNLCNAVPAESYKYYMIFNYNSCQF